MMKTNLHSAMIWQYYGVKNVNYGKNMYNDDQWNPVEGEELSGFLEQIMILTANIKSHQAAHRYTGACCHFMIPALIKGKDPNWVSKI